MKVNAQRLRAEVRAHFPGADPGHAVALAIAIDRFSDKLTGEGRF